MVRLLKEMFIILLGVLAVIYLINPTAGFLEFLPDNIPLVGNVDEGLATTVLIAVLGYYGIDVTKIFGSRLPKRSTPAQIPPGGQPGQQERR